MDLSVARFCHCLTARRQARTLTRFYEQGLRPHGLRATQFSILASLQLKGPTPLGALAESLGLERTSLTRSAGVLEGRGWIEQAPTQDARRRLLTITPTGRRKLKAAFPAWKAAQDEVERLGLEEIDRRISGSEQ